MSQTIKAAEYINNEQPHPGDVKDIKSSIDYAFKKNPSTERLLLPGLKSYMADKPAFWRNATFMYALRDYYFQRRNSAHDKPEAHAFGGKISFESGWWNNASVRIAYYHSIELSSHGPDTGLLAPGQQNISVLGEANLRYRFVNSTPLKGSVIKLYRHQMNLPFVNKHDVRELPVVHEGYSLSRGNSKLDYYLGHITKFKNYDSKDFVSMASAAGAKGSNKGLSIIGARYSFNEQTTLGALEYYGWDTFNMFFVEGTHKIQLTDEVNIGLFAQFTEQHSVGDKLVGDFDTRQGAFKVATSWRGVVLSFAGSITDDGASIRKPWGGTPSYVSMQRYKFDRANEKAMTLGVSYSGGILTKYGLSGFAAVGHGWDAEDVETGQDQPDHTEYDLTLDYKPPNGFLQGLWFRARYNYIDIEGENNNIHDLRLILNYNFRFL